MVLIGILITVRLAFVAAIWCNDNASSHTVSSTYVLPLPVCLCSDRRDTAEGHLPGRVVDVDDYDGVVEHAWVAVPMLWPGGLGDVFLLRKPEEASKVHVSESETWSACADFVEVLAGRRGGGVGILTPPRRRHVAACGGGELVERHG